MATKTTTRKAHTRTVGGGYKKGGKANPVRQVHVKSTTVKKKK